MIYTKQNDTITPQTAYSLCLSCREFEVYMH